MPAWITSELRELVWVPIASSASRITTSRPAIASSRAMARPTTPAPMTMASSLSTRQHPFERDRRHAREGRDRRHRPARAVEERREHGAHYGGGGEAGSADGGRGRAGRLGEGRDGERRRARDDERGAEEEQAE